MWFLYIQETFHLSSGNSQLTVTWHFSVTVNYTGVVRKVRYKVYRTGTEIFTVPMATLMHLLDYCQYTRGHRIQFLSCFCEWMCHDENGCVDPKSRQVWSAFGNSLPQRERRSSFHNSLPTRVYGGVINRQNVAKWCRELNAWQTDVHDE